MHLAPRDADVRRPAALGQPMFEHVPGSLDLEGNESLRATTDAAGRFELLGVSDGLHQLTARAEGLPAWSRDVLVEGASADLGDIALADTRAITGQVRDRQGGPIAEARLWIEAGPEGGVAEWGGRTFSPDSLLESRTGTDGRFRLEGLPEGMFTLLAASPRHVPAAVPEVASGGDVEIVLDDGQTVRGVVLDGIDRSPVAGAHVVLASGLAQLPVPEKAVTTGLDGAFEVPDFGPRKYHAFIWHPAYAAERDTVKVDLGTAEVPTVEFRMRPAGGIEGRIENLEKRNNLQNFVVLRRAGGSEESRLSCPLDRSGDLQRDAIPPGAYEASLREETIDPLKISLDGSFQYKDVTVTETPLGEVVIHAGETARLEYRVP